MIKIRLYSLYPAPFFIVYFRHFPVLISKTSVVSAAKLGMTPRNLFGGGLGNLGSWEAHKLVCVLLITADIYSMVVRLITPLGIPPLSRNCMGGHMSRI